MTVLRKPYDLKWRADDRRSVTHFTPRVLHFYMPGRRSSFHSSIHAFKPFPLHHGSGEVKPHPTDGEPIAVVPAGGGKLKIELTSNVSKGIKLGVHDDRHLFALESYATNRRPTDLGQI